MTNKKTRNYHVSHVLTKKLTHVLVD